MTSKDKFKEMVEAARDVQMYVTPNAGYGDASGIRLFRHGYLTFDEWIFVELELHTDEDVFEYISAILDGDMDKKREIENESK